VDQLEELHRAAQAMAGAIMVDTTAVTPADALPGVVMAVVAMAEAVVATDPLKHFSNASPCA
jgi:hypothetical protein